MPFSEALSIENELIIRGELKQGSLVIGSSCPKCQVFYLGEHLSTTDNGTFIFGLGRDARSPINLTLIDSYNHEKNYSFPVRVRVYDTQRIKGVPQRTVTPSKSELNRIQEDARIVRSARESATDRIDFMSGFIKPVDGQITGIYGSQRIYNGVQKSPHYGIDYAAPKGSIVQAPASGVVTLAHDDLFYSGGTLILDHGFGLSSSFLHLSSILVKHGDVVMRGDPIAKVGSTGRSTGPHLDWRMNWKNIRIDPQLVLRSLPARP
jgi:murein DD-endopeptidase MepM/ murein hydrolase activator NlpD